MNKTDTITISLPKDCTTVIDAVDADLADFEWHVAETSHGCLYAVRSLNKRYVYLHRVILGRKMERNLTNRDFTDHISGNGLDNRRANLRLASHFENMKNRKIHSNNSSGVRGVFWRVSANKWVAQINVNGKHVHLGYFADLADAVAARHAAEIEHYGEFSPLLSRQETS